MLQNKNTILNWQHYKLTDGRLTVTTSRHLGDQKSEYIHKQSRQLTAMARVRGLRTSGIILLLYLTFTTASPLFSINVLKRNCDINKCVYLLNVDGDFDRWSLTPVPGVCNLDNIQSNFIGEDVEIVVDRSAKLYLCGGTGKEWFPLDYHLEGDVIASQR